MSTALAFMSRHATLMFAVGMVTALVAPPVTRIFGPTLPVLIFSMLTLSVLRTDSVALARHIRRPTRAAAVILWMLVISPAVIGTAALKFLPLPADLMAPFLFYTAMPPLTAVPALAVLFGIDAALAVVALMVGSLLTPFILPPMVLLVLGIEVDIGVLELFSRLAVLVFGAFVAGMAIRHFAGKERLSRHAPSLNGLIVIVMMLIVVAVFDGAHETMWAHPTLALSLAALAFGAAIFYQILSAGLFLPFGLETALTAGMLSGNRNLALLLAVLGTSATTEIALFVAIGQLPVYVLPMLQRPLARRLGFTDE